MTYREMLDLLRSKGVRVNEDRNGFKVDGEEGLMKYWMVRLKGRDDDMYMFCCGFDMLGDGKLVISHKEYPMDENVFESLQDAIKRNEGKEYPAERILLMPDLDYYDSSEAPREESEEIEDGGGIYGDLVYSCNDDATTYPFVVLCENNQVLSGTLYKEVDYMDNEVRLLGDIRWHWDRTQPEEKGRTEVHDLKEFYKDAGRKVELAIIAMCEQMGVYVGRGFNL